MKLGVTVGMHHEPAAFIRNVQRLEDAGAEYLWTGEAYTADAVSTLGFLAAITKRAQIGSSILPLYTRTPTLLAMTAAGIDRLSGGRCILGLGASGPQVIEGFHGVPYDRPLARTREIIEICRRVWRHEKLQHDGPLYPIPLPAGQGTGFGKPLKLIEAPLRNRIPIFVAALGRRNVEMTAELAEGWIPIHFWPERAEALWGASIAAGLARRSPDLPALEVVAGGPLAIGEGLEDLRNSARRALALYFGGMGPRGRNYYNDVLRGYGYEREADEVQELYLGGRRKEAAAAIPQELVDGLSLVGEEGFVRERVGAFRDAGVTVLNVTPVGPDPIRSLETVASWLA